MRSSSVSIALLVPLAVSASPIDHSEIFDDIFCKVNSIVVSALHKDAVATSYCSSYLSIQTSTISTTATQTPSSVYSTITVTATAAPDTITETQTATTGTEVTSTSTVIETSYTTTTLTTSTATISCLTEAYTYTAPVGVVPAVQSQVPVKRDEQGDGSPINKPFGIPREWPSSRVSKACSCLSIPTPFTTTTLTQTLPTGTITVFATQTTTPTITESATATETSTNTATTQTTETVTSTVTAYAVATTIASSSSGLQWRKYTHSFDANLVNPGFTSTFFKNKAADFSGASNSLSFATPNWPSGSTQLTLPGHVAFEASQAAVLMQGFFIARQTGTYVFVSSENTVDNWGYMWIGDNAYSAWDDSNTAFQSSRTGSPYVTGSTSIQLNAGDAVPITYLWANGGGVGRSSVVIVRNGQLVAAEFVQACSSSVFA